MRANIVPELATISFCFVKVANVGIHFKWSGREFHNFVPFIEKAVWANDVLRKGILQLSFNADRVADLVRLCCLVIILQRDMGAALFRHLKTNLTKCREVKFSKLKILYLLRI